MTGTVTTSEIRIPIPARDRDLVISEYVDALVKGVAFTKGPEPDESSVKGSGRDRDARLAKMVADHRATVLSETTEKVEGDKKLLYQLYLYGLFVYKLPAKEMTYISEKLDLSPSEYQRLCRHAIKVRVPGRRV